MKIGRLVYDKKQKDMSDKVFCNYGDNIQTIALDYILEELYPSEEIVNVNIYDLPTYSGEYILLPLNCNFWTCDENYFIPASEKIIPIFVAVSFQLPPTSKRAIDYLKKYEPIGCRDHETYRMMQELGISAYINGCATMTLPKRTSLPCNKKVFLVDIPSKLYPKIPKELMENAEVIKQTVIFDNDVEGGIVNTDAKTKELYSRYKQEASLVITSKLHCASPCIAMGIPVVVARDNRSCRFEWLNKFTKVYTEEEFDTIDWNPEVKDVEIIKQQIKSVISQRIQEAYVKYKNMLTVSDFFEESQKDALSVKEQIIHAIRSSQKDSYIIWGVGGYLGNAIYQIIKKECPDKTLVAAIDEYKDCDFHGLRTQKSSVLQEYEDVFVFVATATGSPVAEEYMNSIGMVKGEDYFTFSMIN